MKIYNGLDAFDKPNEGCVLTIGNFDGVHLGHQAILKRAFQLARSESLALVGMTFDPSATKVLRPDRSPRVLTPMPIKIRLLEEQKLDALIVIEPTMEFLSLTPPEFIEQIVVERIGARHVVEGQTFNFGQRRRGTIISLRALGEQFGFKTHLVPACTMAVDDGASVAVSSTLVRQAVLTSQFAKAKQFLGRAYAIGGEVVAGRGQGSDWCRRMGFLRRW